MHLAPSGSSSCDYGETVSENECEIAGKILHPRASRKMQVGSGGTCGSWGQVPLGCSVQSGGDGATHFKKSGHTAKNCSIHQMYQLVCKGKGKLNLEHLTQINVLIKVDYYLHSKAPL